MSQQLSEPLAIQRLLRLNAVKLATGLSRSAIYDKIKRGEFPAPIHLGPRAVAWVATEVSNWIEQCIAASRNVTEAL